MNAFFGLDTNYEQSNFNEISAEDLVLISGGAGSGGGLDASACQNAIYAASGMGALIGGVIGAFFTPVGATLGTAAGAMMGGGWAASHDPFCVA